MLTLSGDQRRLPCKNENLSEHEALLEVSQTKWEGRISIYKNPERRKKKSRQKTYRERRKLRLHGKMSFKSLLDIWPLDFKSSGKKLNIIFVLFLKLFIEV